MSKRAIMGRRDDLLGPQEELWQIKMLMLKYEHCGGFTGCCHHWDALTASKAPRTPVATCANRLISVCNVCDTSVQISHLYPVTRGTPLFFQMT